MSFWGFPNHIFKIHLLNRTWCRLFCFRENREHLAVLLGVSKKRCWRQEWNCKQNTKIFPAVKSWNLHSLSRFVIFQVLWVLESHKFSQDKSFPLKVCFLFKLFWRFWDARLSFIFNLIVSRRVKVYIYKTFAITCRLPVRLESLIMQIQFC